MPKLTDPAILEEFKEEAQLMKDDVQAETTKSFYGSALGIDPTEVYLQHLKKTPQYMKLSKQKKKQLERTLKPLAKLSDEDAKELWEQLSQPGGKEKMIIRSTPPALLQILNPALNPLPRVKEFIAAFEYLEQQQEDLDNYYLLQELTSL